jgi:hypothetical protein
MQVMHAPTVVEQCMTEQKYVRGAMMRSLLYLQVRCGANLYASYLKTGVYELLCGGFFVCVWVWLGGWGGRWVDGWMCSALHF